MSTSKFRIWLLFSFLSAAICLASVLLNLRQTAGVYLAKDIFDQVREETRYFASDLLWQRVDTYGHFGEWTTLGPGVIAHDKVDTSARVVDEMYVPQEIQDRMFIRNQSPTIGGN